MNLLNFTYFIKKNVSSVGMRLGDHRLTASPFSLHRSHISVQIFWLMY
jgi:hypothetical protein